MLDEIVNLSFDLDFLILQSTQLGKLKDYMKELDNPTIKTDNLFLEYEKFYKKTKTAFNEMFSILTQCDEQRKVYLY
jgi:hypothetical protein